jgi:hypothetical protein
MPSFSLQIRASEDGAIYRLDEGDIIDWKQGESFRRGRGTALLQPKDGEGRERRRPIRVEPLVSNSTLVGRERLVSQWAVMRVYDASGNPKSPIEERGVNFKNANAVAAKHEAEEDWANPHGE